MGMQAGVDTEQRWKTNRRKVDGDVSPELTGLRCVLSALDPPRSIPNRVVQRRSAEGTGGMTPWETRSMHLCGFDAAWSSGSSSGS